MSSVQWRGNNVVTRDKAIVLTGIFLVNNVKKQELRLKRFFDSTSSSGPKSLPQSMTTAHQEMKAQLAAMQQQQQHQGPNSIDISDMEHFWG